MFKKVLVANRGEIACRVFRTCRRLGISTVAVYSDADADALHVQMANEAYRIGPPPATESYLQSERIVDVAVKAGVDAIHPGYGFLSENASFAEMCENAGIRFVGPSPQAIRDMGDKLRARECAIEAGVPVLPGTEGAVAIQDAAKHAERIGYPLLVKAASGGGGMGIVRVSSESELANAIRRAESAGRNAFGNAAVYLERFLEHASHIELQVFADRYGNVIHLFERDCSVQRRNQKLIEESPSAKLNDELRLGLHEASVRLAKRIGYANAGTVEFVVDREGNFYFIEMNTRLQVEHGVTEMITGFDLVEMQLRVALKEPLPITQDEVRSNGHAIEARVYAEDPETFLPSTGTVTDIHYPDGEGLRIDHALKESLVIGPYYDPLIAKVIAWGEDRGTAIERLRKGLTDFRIGGLRTNTPAVQTILKDPEFVDGTYDTTLIARRAIERANESKASEQAQAPGGPNGRESLESIAAVAAALYVDERLAAVPQSDGEGQAPPERPPWWHAGLRRQLTTHPMRSRSSMAPITPWHKPGAAPRQELPAHSPLSPLAPGGAPAKLRIRLSGSVFDIEVGKTEA